jgi:hypothetical protein
MRVCASDLDRDRLILPVYYQHSCPGLPQERAYSAFILAVFRQPDGGECSIPKLADDCVSTVSKRVTRMNWKETS